MAAGFQVVLSGLNVLGLGLQVQRLRQKGFYKTQETPFGNGPEKKPPLGTKDHMNYLGLLDLI